MQKEGEIGRGRKERALAGRRKEERGKEDTLIVRDSNLQP